MSMHRTMPYRGGDSPYRPRPSPHQKEYTPSAVVAGSRYTSPYRNSDHRDAYNSSPRRYTGPNISSGASIATSRLDNMIDNAMSRRPPPPSVSNSYRNPSPSSSRMPPSRGDRDSFSKLHSRTTSVPSRGYNNSEYRSGSVSRRSSNEYHAREPSPRYGRDDASYVSRRMPMTGESSTSPSRSSYGSGWRDDGGSSAPRDIDRDRGADAYGREMGFNGRREYSYDDRNGSNYEDAGKGRRGADDWTRDDHRRGADDWTRDDQRYYGGREVHADMNTRGGSRGDSPYHSRQPATSYGQRDVYRQELERSMEHYHTEVP